MNLPALPFPWWSLLLLAGMSVAALLWLLRAGHPFLPRRIRMAVIGLRSLALLALLLAALDPYWSAREPDPTAYRLSVLVDASRSMETRDMPDGESRLEWVARWLASEPALAEASTPVEFRLFSSESRLWDGLPLTASLPGQTALGDALASLEPGGERGPSSQLGGVLLLSDGIHLHGSSPIEAAQDLARQQIPLSVIGVGRAAGNASVAVRFARETLTLPEGEPGEVELLIDNGYPDTRTGRLAVYQNRTLLEERPLVLPAQGQSTETFSLEGAAPGVETLRAVFKPDYPGGNPAGHVSFSIATIERRDEYRILFMAEQAGWLARLLRQLATEKEALLMDSLIRVDEERFFLTRHPPAGGAQGTTAPALQRESISALPDSAGFYQPYDALILDLGMAMAHGERLAPVLEAFAGTRGGGLLLLHNRGSEAPAQPLPEAIRSLFPVRSAATVLNPAPAPLAFDVNPLFAEQIGGSLFGTPAPVLPGSAFLGQAGELSRAAQVSARLRDSRLPLLVTQAYGAGRTAWLGSEAVWQWKIGEGSSPEHFAAFWEALLSWLAVGGKDRLQAPVNGTILPMDELASLDVQVLGPDYTPRMDAAVSALLTDPQGRATEHRLVPSIDQPGRYQLALPLGDAGAYQVDYAVRFPGGDELAQTAWFAVAATSEESRQTAFQEKTLRDMARLGGGQYHSFEDWDDLLPLPVSSRVPLVEKRISWTRSTPFLLLGLLFFLMEWWLRRRHGLR